MNVDHDQRESESTEPVWTATSEATSYDPLPGDRAADVTVVGGGIAGLSTAVELAEAGCEVALVEADRICTGVTGKTTAKLTALHGLVYDDVRSEQGEAAARRYALANQRAIETVADRVAQHGIDCGFERTPAYSYTTRYGDRERIRAEVDAAEEAGLPATFVEDVPLPWDVEAAVRVDDQARFHPRNYLVALAEVFEDAGGELYEQTRVTDVESGEPSRVVTEHGEVRSDDVVLATHFPVLDRQLLFARQYAHRSYVLAVRARDGPDEGMYYRPGEPTRSVRPHATREDLLLVTGEGHEPGRTDEAERYRRLERWARERFDVEAIPYRWSTQDYETADGLPIVGPAGPGTEGRYVATGFGGWGLTNGTAAGSIVADQILGRSNDVSEVYDPGRFTDAQRLSPSKLLTVVGENVDVGREFVSGWASGLLGESTDALDPGEATVRREGGEPVALYREESGERHAVSAVCTHLDCVVEWNGAERTWDCPCHGSRFTPEGDVLDGPAVEDLPRRSRE